MLFDKLCRRPGTRCNRIMSLIERGMSDKDIAALLKNTPGQPQNRDCDADTIAVYRKALNGMLTSGEGEDRGWRMDDKKATRERVKLLLEAGKTANEIATVMGLTWKQVDNIQRTLSGKPRRKKKTIFDEIGVDREEVTRLMKIFADKDTKAKLRAIESRKGRGA